MRILIDTDVLLDVFLARKPNVSSSAAVLDWAERNPGCACVSWHGLANLHYLSRTGAEGFIADLLDFCDVPAVDTSGMRQALALGFPDLEDAMQVVVAQAFPANLIVTRNVRDYARSAIPATTPVSLVPKLV